MGGTKGMCRAVERSISCKVDKLVYDCLNSSESRPEQRLESVRSEGNHSDARSTEDMHAPDKGSSGESRP
jgi:hypothetical protein